MSEEFEWLEIIGDPENTHTQIEQFTEISNDKQAIIVAFINGMEVQRAIDAKIPQQKK